MVAVKIFVSVWHPNLSANDIVANVRFEPIVTANKGDERGKGGAKFSETYCHFKVSEIEVEREAELFSLVIYTISPLDALSSLVASGGRVWVTAKIPPEVYEVPFSQEDMRKLSASGLGFSLDVSAVS